MTSGLYQLLFTPDFKVTTVMFEQFPLPQGTVIPLGRIRT